MSEIVESMPWKEKVADAVRYLGTHEQVDCPLRHYFLPGVYIREITMPAGSFIIGKIHRTRHFNIIQRGRCSLVSESGTEDLTGPLTFVSEAGVQKALYIHEETVWSTVHLTEERELEALEAALIEADPSYPLFERAEERAAIAAAAQILISVEK